jgi:F420H(2)-dependent quinone reductase
MAMDTPPPSRRKRRQIHQRKTHPNHQPNNPEDRRLTNHQSTTFDYSSDNLAPRGRRWRRLSAPHKPLPLSTLCQSEGAGVSLSARVTNLISTRFPTLGRSGTRFQVNRYRSSDGTKGSMFVGYRCFLLDVVGRKSGERRPVMLIHVPMGQDLIVIGSGAGTPNTPNWYKNLIAAGGGQVQVGAERWKVAVREVTEGLERDRYWALAVKAYPGFESYRSYTLRLIPVAVLERSEAK